MNKKVVAVFFGGISSEHDVSRESAATIISHMSDEKYMVVPVYITRDGKWFLYDGPIENIKNVHQIETFGARVTLSSNSDHAGLLRIVNEKAKNIKIDVAFPVLHGMGGEDGTIQGIFEMAGIPYVGCGVLASSIAMDKVCTKLIAEHLGIPQAQYLHFSRENIKNNMNDIAKEIRYKIGYPAFVKPANAGSSIGVSKVMNKKELEKALLLASEYDRKVIVEKAVVGRELECSVLGGYEDVEVSCVGEIIPALEFYDFDAKYNNPESQVIFSAEIEEKTSEEIRSMAIQIFKALDCYGLSRVDFFLEAKTNKVIFNEINTMPGFTSISMYHMLWRQSGIPMEKLIDTLIELALERWN